jgi:RimJ/RimL family protein N-acetyltransferase
MIDPERVLFTPRSALHYPRMADAPAILAAVTDPLFPEELPIAQLRTLEQIEAAIQRCAELRATGNLLGMVSVGQEESPRVWSLGYWIHPAEWGRGHATEIASVAVRVAFDELGAERVIAGAALWNVPSQRVLEKLGFSFEHENPRGYEIQKRPVPTREYALTQQNWAQTLPGRPVAS